MKYRITAPLWYSFTLHLLAAAILVQCGFIPLSALRVGNTPVEAIDTVMIELQKLNVRDAIGQKKAAVSERHPIIHGRVLSPVLKYSASTEKTTGLHSTTLHQIMRQIARARRYPPVARRQQLEGRPIVQFRIARNGQIASATVVQTSGHALLDTAALDTIRRAAPLPYYAEAIRLPIRFTLR